MGQTFLVPFYAHLSFLLLKSSTRLSTTIVNSSLYHWADIQYAGKFWSGKKLVKLASGIPFVNFTLQILFLQSVVAIHAAHSPMFYMPIVYGLAHSPILFFYPTKHFPCMVATIAKATTSSSWG